MAETNDRFAPSRHISVPAPPEKRAPREFPLLASTAPVVASVLMWVVTQSAFALVFACLGPLVALASLVDDRRQRRRNARAERDRFVREVAAALAAIDALHDGERLTLQGAAIHPASVIADDTRDPEWWRAGPRTPILVCLGLGSIPSSITLDPPTSYGAEEVDEAYRRLRSAAATTTDAPVLVDARDGIGIVGGRVPAAALARAVVGQLALQLSPAVTQVALGDGGCFDWAAGLPHQPSAGGTPDRATFRIQGTDPDHPLVLCAIAETPNALPRECRVLVRITRGGRAVLEKNPSGPTVEHLRPWLLSKPQAAQLALRAREVATREGLIRFAGAMPDAVSLSTVQPAAAAPHRLPADFAVGAAGTRTIDLVGDGPHAIVGGTTGAGKSELLVSWVLAMAIAAPPAEVNFLLVDFKGGSSFAALNELPHTVGLITDLDQASAERALVSLRAEVRYRERIIASAGARSIDDVPAPDRLPRLVIAVDEFAVVMTEFPQLQALFADLAARGRSLGVHLILSTQRPAGVIRDSVLANCSLRLSLRVNNPGDSTAVIGTPDAAELAPRPAGRAYLSIAGSAPVLVQVAQSGPSDAERVSSRWAGYRHRARRPWCEPLPATIDIADLHQDGSVEEGVAFGMCDLPEEQTRAAARYSPGRDGNLIVVGGHGAGKTGTLAAIEDARRRVGGGVPTIRIPSEVEAAWDDVAAAVGDLDTSGRRALYLLDDIDALIARFPDEYQLPFTEQLTRLLRDGPGRGSTVVMTAARISARVQSLVTLCDSRLLLRMPNRQEHLLAGGDRNNFEADLPAGAGWWRGHRVQVAKAPQSALSRRTRPLVQFPREGLVIVAADASATADRCRALPGAVGGPSARVVELGAAPTGVLPTGAAQLAVGSGDSAQILVGDPAGWQAHWALFAAARAGGDVLFVGCSTADFRSVAGVRTLPPPLEGPPGGAWMLRRSGEIERVQWSQTP